MIIRQFWVYGAHLYHKDAKRNPAYGIAIKKNLLQQGIAIRPYIGAKVLYFCAVISIFADCT